MLYPRNFEQKIGFNEIRNHLHAHCLSTMGHEKVDTMSFQTDAALLRSQHQQTNELQLVLNIEKNQPEQDFYDLRATLERIRVEGTRLEENELWELHKLLNTLHSWLEVIQQTEDNTPRYPALDKLSQGVFTFYAVTKRIEQILDKYGHIKDEASVELAQIRREIRRSEGSVSHALNRILKAAKSEGLVDKDATPTLRDGRLVLPVSPAMKRRIPGIVHDESATGKTIFIEPTEVVEANNRIRELEANEKREVIRILNEFTASLRPNLKEFTKAFHFLADIEFIRAKALFSQQIQAATPLIEEYPIIDWSVARHPLLLLSLNKQGKKVVPLDISLHRKQRILVISGPNAGGKSVCLKTVGLLQYMLQCGLPVPMSPNSRTGIFHHIFIDIGDEQSIEDDLSTYSSHLLNMKNMMKGCDPSSLLLIDEFGGGTEPTIGGAIAEAVLKRFVQRGAFGVITTHYQNLKHFADDTPTVVNGAMLYDRHRMEALFQLEIGNPGSSFAIEIARKTGIPEEVIEDATNLVGQDYVNADKYLLDITRDKRYWEGKRQTIHSQEKQMLQTIQKYEREIEELQAKRKEIINDAKNTAAQIIQDSNKVVENTIREIREAQAEKERTRTLRQQLDAFKTDLEKEKQHERDELIERKIQQLAERKKRKEERKAEKKKKQETEVLQQKESAAAAALAKERAEQPLQKGDTVRLKGQQTTGVIEELQGKKATVTFGMMRTVVELSRLIRSTETEKTATPQKQKVSITTLMQENAAPKGSANDIKKARTLKFSQEIDVRGMRGDEALQAVTYFIDDAIMVGVAKVRILHGTGNGILRQLIRQYLRTISGVRTAYDEHVQFGGAGITVVELD